jgi:hypothetical protein
MTDLDQAKQRPNVLPRRSGAKQSSSFRLLNSDPYLDGAVALCPALVPHLKLSDAESATPRPRVNAVPALDVISDGIFPG